MSSKKTSILELHDWSGSDRVSREEIGENFEILDGVLGRLDLTQFVKRLQNGLVTKIKLIGDSITEGVGATGHVSPPPNTQPVIFNDGAGTVFYEGGYTERSWANFFREYIAANYPGNQFVNAGIAGKSAKWANANKQFWVGNEDVVFVMLGTNDRWDNTDVAGFKSDLTSFLAYVKQHCNLMIVMTATPTLNDYADDAGKAPNTTDYKFWMKEVDRVITEVCIANGYPFISHYRQLLSYSRFRGVPLSALMQGRTVGSHPLDAGHNVMWQTLQQSLGIIDNALNWDGSKAVPYSTVPRTFDYSTPANDQKFDSFYAIYVSPAISNSNPNVSQYPEGKGGVLTLYKSENDAFVWEEYQVRDSGRLYRRYWNYVNPTTGNWSSWTALAGIYPRTFDYSTMGIDAMFAGGFNVTYLAPGISNSDPNIGQYPEAKGGVLSLVKGDSNAFIWEEYQVRDSGRKYRRYWNYVDAATGSWTLWIAMGEGFIPGGTAANQIGFNTAITAFPEAQTRTMIKSTHPDIASFPGGKQGVLKTHRYSFDEQFSYQEFNALDGTKYTRLWNAGTSLWKAFSQVGNVYFTNSPQRLSTDPIMAYPIGTFDHSEIGSSNSTIAQFPTGATGLLITYRGTTDLYSYQEYHLRQSVSVYKRYWDNAGATWSAWTKISAV